MIKSYVTVAMLLLFLPACIDISAQDVPRVIHVFVALCDNVHQGIVPVPSKLGNGDDPGNNLYWGAKYGVKTFFTNSQHWRPVSTIQPTNPVLERCVFQHTQENVYLVADAYQGSKIQQAILDFLKAASGTFKDSLSLQTDTTAIDLNIHGASALVVYVGHNGLMDFQLPDYPQKQDEQPREAIMLACLSQPYFSEPLLKTGAHPLLWTTGLMAPEAYTLEYAIEGWIYRENDEKIRLRAAQAYHTYQKCGLTAAKRLFVTGK